MPGRYNKVRKSLNKVRTTILLNGPSTLYKTHRVLQPKADLRLKVNKSEKHVKLVPRNPPLSTVANHLKILQDEGELVVYGSESYRSGRDKRYYGLTLYGFLRAFRIPGNVATKNFKRLMEIWLPQKKFQFFLPKKEVLEALSQEELVIHLSKLCQMVANSLPEAEDFAYYVQELGYNESDLTPLIIDLAVRFSQTEHREEYAEALKVLCRYLPTFKGKMHEFIQGQRTTLDYLERELNLDVAGGEKE